MISTDEQNELDEIMLTRARTLTKLGGEWAIQEKQKQDAYKFKQWSGVVYDHLIAPLTIRLKTFPEATIEAVKDNDKIITGWRVYAPYEAHDGLKRLAQKEIARIDPILRYNTYRTYHSVDVEGPFLEIDLGRRRRTKKPNWEGLVDEIVQAVGFQYDRINAKKNFLQAKADRLKTAQTVFGEVLNLIEIEENGQTYIRATNVFGNVTDVQVAEHDGRWAVTLKLNQLPDHQVIDLMISLGALNKPSKKKGAHDPANQRTG
jgi:hypothetical protein